MDSRRPSPKTESIRLQKYLAECGVGSRRGCETLIEEGLVTVDDEVIVEQGVRVDPRWQRVCVRGVPVQREAKVYLALNKPRDVVCTSHDPEGRRTVQSYVPNLSSRVYTVGRLDRNSEGLILLTNDGEFANALTHPRHHISKEYLVWSIGEIDEAHRHRMVEGMTIDGEPMRAMQVDYLQPAERGGLYRVILQQGRKRQIRRMFEASDARVSRLKRVAVGSLKLGELKVGEVRPLHPEEVSGLLREAKSRPRHRRH